MLHEYSRMELLIGEEGLKRLKNARVAVFGIGGVGSYVAEALARCGIGTLILVDNDQVSLTNLNRQLIALHSTIGQAKTEVMKDRIRDINPEIVVHTYETFFMEDTAELFDFSSYDYVVDAVDTVTAKLLLIEMAAAAGTPVISSMGTGNKLDPGRFEITDIQNKCMPAGKSDAQGIEEARHKEMQGAVLEGGTHQKQGVRGKQRDCKTSGSGEHRLCAWDGRADDRRRGCQGPAEDSKERRITDDR